MGVSTISRSLSADRPRRPGLEPSLASDDKCGGGGDVEHRHEHPECRRELEALVSQQHTDGERRKVSHQRERRKHALRQPLQPRRRGRLQSSHRRAEPALRRKVLEEEGGEGELKRRRAQRGQPKRHCDQRAGRRNPLASPRLRGGEAVCEGAAAERRGGAGDAVDGRLE